MTRLFIIICIAGIVSGCKPKSGVYQKYETLSNSYNACKDVYGCFITKAVLDMEEVKVIYLNPDSATLKRLHTDSCNAVVFLKKLESYSK